MHSSRHASSTKVVSRCFGRPRGDGVAQSAQREQEHLFHGQRPDPPRRLSRPGSPPRRSYPTGQKTGSTTGHSRRSSRQKEQSTAGPITHRPRPLSRGHSENRLDQRNTGPVLSPSVVRASPASTWMHRVLIPSPRCREVQPETSNVRATRETVVRPKPPVRKTTRVRSPAGLRLAIAAKRPERSIHPVNIHERFRSGRETRQGESRYSKTGKHQAPAGSPHE